MITTIEAGLNRQITKLNAQRLGFTDTGSSLIKEIKGSKYAISPMKGINELTEAVALQQEVWKLSDYDLCPPHMWVTAIDTGGHVLGARNEKGQLVGFAAGFGGYDVQEKHTFILSDMVAVKEHLRSLNIGFTIKLAQALYVDNQGIPEIRWTYDPLRLRNGYLNLHKLGAVVTEFYINKYGNSLTGSQNTDITDRFLARWFIGNAETQNKFTAQSLSAQIDGIPIVEPDNLPESQYVAVEIPLDIDLLTPEQRVVEQLRFRAIASLYITKRNYHCVDCAITGKDDNKQRSFYIFKKAE